MRDLEPAVGKKFVGREWKLALSIRIQLLKNRLWPRDPTDDEERGEASALLLPVRAEAGSLGLRRLLQQRAIPRIARQRRTGRCLLRTTVCGAE